MHGGNQTSEPGFLLLDQGGQICLSTGHATDPRLRMLLSAQLDEAASRTLRTLELDGRPLVVLRCKLREHTLFLIHPADECDALLDFVASVDFAYPLLNHMLSDRFEAITVIGNDARVRYISPTHEAFFGLSHGEAVGMPVQNVIENTRLHRVIQTGRAEIGQIQEMRGVSRVVARTPIRQNGRVIGAIGRVMFKGPEQLLALSQEIADLKSELAMARRKLSATPSRDTRPLDMIVGRSEAIRQLKSDLLRVAPLEVPVLLAGESGTGKELAAHALHTLSPRAGQAMVLVNSAALPATLVESELFGYDAGAFTGAERKGRRGKFELADRSTLFLDEVGDMPVEVQAKLLRVLADKTFERVGGERQRHSDFRLISATNRDLPEMTRAGCFRLDLFYRISTVVLRMPPLRERPEDIRPIVDDFIQSQRRVRHVRPDVYEYLAEQSWPGNVRQLLHEVEKATIFADSAELCRADFRLDPLERRRADTAASLPQIGTHIGAQTGPKGPRIHESTHQVAQAMVRDALDRFGGNKRRVAQELGISRSYLYRLLQTMPDAASSA
jgi:transcriptional regulator with PAS, ATPase and Fis domain